MSTRPPDADAWRSLPSLPAGRGRLSLYLELSKARLTCLVLATTLVGYVMAVPGSFDLSILLWTLLGTAACAAGANALNQRIEMHRDARMERTRQRPLPTGLLLPAHALVWGAATASIGTFVLYFGAGPLAAGLALATVLLYLLAYTPLKSRSSLCTLAGAAVGAIPPMIGWAAAADRLDIGAWVLGSLLFVWQIPHFMSLAWVYRRDYARGGFRVLPVIDASGEVTSQVVVLYSLVLLPIGLAMTLVGAAGWLYAVGSLAMGALLVGLSWRLYRLRTETTARRVFVSSLFYLPLVLGLMLADRAPLRQTTAAAGIRVSQVPSGPAIGLGGG